MSFSQSNPAIPQLFSAGNAGILGPVESTGKDLFYHGNHIAKYEKGALFISNGGYQPRSGAPGSLSTKFLLSHIDGVKLTQARNKWFLDGKEWDGEWIKVKGVKAPKLSKTAKEPAKYISLRTAYVRTDGWRGYSQPVNAVVGANDTGSWDDSPCPTNLATKELLQASDILKKAKIKFKATVCESSNVFCVHRYLVTSEADRARAKDLIQPIIDQASLLYIPHEPAEIEERNKKVAAG